MSNCKQKLSRFKTPQTPLSVNTIHFLSYDNRSKYPSPAFAYSVKLVLKNSGYLLIGLAENCGVNFCQHKWKFVNAKLNA